MKVSVNNEELAKRRFYDDPKARLVRCSNCIHRKDKLKMKCTAFPDYIPKSVRVRIRKEDPKIHPCNNNVFYEPDDGIWLITGKEYSKIPR